MKGVRKNVVEVLQPGDEDIERVLVFLKPDSEAVRLGRAEDKATTWASGLVTWRPASSSWLRAAAALAVLGALAALVWWLG